MSDESSTNSSDSDISFDEEFSLLNDFSKLNPFNFEPLVRSSEDEYYSAEDSHKVTTKSKKKEMSKPTRLENLDLCKCKHCKIMETDLESVCCQELSEISDEKFEGKCIFFSFTIDHKRVI